jgi:hypothetical protein
MSAHTKGPWNIGPDGDTIHGGPHRMMVARAAFPSPGAWSQSIADSMDANARPTCSPASAKP